MRPHAPEASQSAVRSEVVICTQFRRLSQRSRTPAPLWVPKQCSITGDEGLRWRGPCKPGRPITPTEAAYAADVQRPNRLCVFSFLKECLGLVSSLSDLATIESVLKSHRACELYRSSEDPTPVYNHSVCQNSSRKCIPRERSRGELLVLQKTFLTRTVGILQVPARMGSDGGALSVPVRGRLVHRVLHSAPESQPAAARNVQRQ